MRSTLACLCRRWSAVLLLSVFGPAFGSAVAPVVVPGNPTCTDISAGSVGFSIPGPDAGGAHVNPADGATITIVNVGDTMHFDWSASLGGFPLGIDAVIVKAGNGANVYLYNPELSSDAGLQTPGICGQGNNQCGLSHFVFCYDYEVFAAKTADTRYERRYLWDIDKSAQPSSLNLFVGDSGDVGYAVTATKSEPIDFGFTISGTVTVVNPAPMAATVAGITDVLAGSPVALDCGVAFPYALASHGTLTCSYSAGVDDRSTRTNVATVSTTGAVGGATATATAEFGAPAVVHDDAVNVVDTNGMSWEFGDSGTRDYSATYTCEDQPGHRNTATIAETGATASADVAIACYNLDVTKTAATHWQRNWTWRIGKRYESPALNVDINNDGAFDGLLVSNGQSVLLGYSILVDAASSAGDFGVDGAITVSNNNPARDATLAGVADSVSGAGSLNVICPSLTVPAGGSLVCTYGGSMPNGDARTNVATATQQNFHYAADGTSSPAGTSAYNGSAAVVFNAAPTSEIDECVAVSDFFNGVLIPQSLGNVCANQAPRTLSFAATFTYDATLPPCSMFALRNRAAFTTNDSGSQGAGDATITIVNRDCAGGCTLTPGYWKTHSSHGPARFDDTWNNVPGGADATFFLAGKSWYQTLWTAPQGNVYWILARAYIAAVLNQFNGATVSVDVQSAINQATALFQQYTPVDIGKLKGGSPLRSTFISLAALLDMYNNGLNPDGPPHCTEDSTSGT